MGVGVACSEGVVGKGGRGVKGRGGSVWYI